MTTPKPQRGGIHQDARADGQGQTYQIAGDAHFGSAPPPRRRAGKVLAIAATVVAAMLLGSFLSNKFSQEGTDDRTRTGSDTQVTAAPPPATGSTGPAAGSTGPAADRERFHDDMRLVGIDLDASPPEITGRDFRLSGFAVLYPNLTGEGATAFNSPGGNQNRGLGLALYEGSGNPRRQDCVNRLKAGGTETLGVQKGTRFCVRTAGGRVGFITVKAFDGSGALGSGAFVGSVLIWEGTG
ncbi:hypothetical protein [Kitasatospora sp. NPDC059327]|uniref:hypothetical protein n=1 Tax=Kitasatospora sp. NPDC059327 TaxID=3346803 RepID=UPI0036BBF090